MRTSFALTTLFLTCLPYGDFIEYHYDRPQVPLHVGLAPQTGNLQHSYTHSAPIYNTIVQDYINYGIAQPVRQPALASNSYQSSHATAQNYQHPSATYNQRGVGVGTFGGNVAASYQPQQQQQKYSPNLNPFTQYSQGQQQQVQYVNLPLSQQQYHQQNYANSQQQYNAGAGGSFGSGTSFGVGDYSSGTNGAHFGANSIGSNGFGNAGANGQIASQGQTSNFISQSESGQLHLYQHQQKPTGNTVPFSRQVTHCSPNGQCQSYTLAPGQQDPQHLRNAAFSRAKAQPTSEKCRLLAVGYSYPYPANQSKGGYDYSIKVEKRPSDRRLAPYTEIILPKDPYN